MDAMHELIRTPVRGREAELATQGLLLLARLSERTVVGGKTKPIEQAVSQAMRMMEADLGEARSIPDLASHLGVGYSYFRREFRLRTGVSPQQYQLRLRMQRVQRLLGATELSIKEIADRLEFSSPYHLSAAFKTHFGLSPRAWRKFRKERRE